MSPTISTCQNQEDKDKEKQKDRASFNAWILLPSIGSLLSQDPSILCYGEFSQISPILMCMLLLPGQVRQFYK